MNALGMLRWGDVQNIQFNATVAQENTNVPIITKQLVAANWPVPMSWNVLLFALPFVDPSDGGNWKVNWLFSLGCGQAASSSIPLFTMGPFATAQNGIVQQQQQLVPSSNLQIQAQAIGNFQSSKTNTLYVGAFVAPNNAEPLAEQEFIKAMKGEPSAYDKSGEMRWMPMGFWGDQDPLSYKPR